MARTTQTKAAGGTARWTLDKQARFLGMLAGTCNVAKSCRAVGMVESGVYKLRMKSPAFREAWDVALREGYVRLEMMMLERAMAGTVKPVFHGGKRIAQVREFDTRLAGQLLAAHAKVKAVAPPPADEDVHALLLAQFEEMEARLAAEI